MLASILVPVLNEEKNLPRLFTALTPLLRENPECELLFIDNRSTDKSLAQLKKFSKSYGKQVRIFVEQKRGFAPPLNLGVKQAKGKKLLFLDADALPDAQWLSAMLEFLDHFGLVVGKTISGPATSVWGEISERAFQDHSARTVQAIGYSLPWGPTCNLGVRKEWFTKVGNFSPSAAGAFDIDWCWRAVLAGAKIQYTEKASVVHYRRQERDDLLRQFERYGLSEAWIHHHYQFLEEAEPSISPLDRAMLAKNRFLELFPSPHREEVLQVAMAFACGVYGGFAGAYSHCKMRRKLPQRPISWPQNQEEVLFVPRLGLTNLNGETLQVWRWIERKMGRKEIIHEMEHLWGWSNAQAKSFYREFSKAIGI